MPLAWDVHPAQDIIRYDIYRAESQKGPFARVGSVNGRETTSWLDGGRDPGSLADDCEYHYCIRAINSVSSESADSDIVVAVTRPPPPPVEGLAAVTGLPRKVELTWEPSMDEKTVAYEIERAEEAGSFASIGRVEGLESIRHSDSGPAINRPVRARGNTPLKDGTAYSYRIRALNIAGAASDWCEPVAAVTKVTPAAPAGLRISRGKARTVELEWDANQEEDIAEYVVEASTAADRGFSEAGRVAAGNTCRFKQDGLPPNLTRYYRIKAADGDGLQSDWSEAVAGSTKPLPDAPTDLTVEWEDEVARLSCKLSPQRYVVQYRLLNKWFMWQDELAVTDKAEHFFSSEALAKKLVVMVAAVDQDGLESPFSAPLEIRKPK